MTIVYISHQPRDYWDWLLLWNPNLKQNDSICGNAKLRCNEQTSIQCSMICQPSHVIEQKDGGDFIMTMITKNDAIVPMLSGAVGLHIYRNSTLVMSHGANRYVKHLSPLLFCIQYNMIFPRNDHKTVIAEHVESIPGKWLVCEMIFNILRSLYNMSAFAIWRKHCGSWHFYR